MIEFVQKAKQGSEKAFMVLVDNMKAQMYKTALVRLRDEQDALDAVQETLIKAFSSIKTLREDRFFKTWIIRILLNECFNIQQYKRKIIPMDEGIPLPSGDNTHDPVETIHIHSILKQLDDIYKEVIDLRYNHDLKVDDISKVLDIPVGTVKSRLNRAHSLLKIQLGQEDLEKEVLS